MKLHKLALKALCASFVVSTAFGQGAFTSPEITVSSNALTMVAGPASAKWAPAWTTSTAYAQGAVVKNAGSQYFAVIAGTSTNVAGGGPAIMGQMTDGTVTWRNACSKERQSLFVQNTGTDTGCVAYVFTTYGGQTNIANAVALYAGGSVSFSPGEVPQGPVYVISTRNTKVTVFER